MLISFGTNIEKNKAVLKMSFFKFYSVSITQFSLSLSSASLFSSDIIFATILYHLKFFKLLFPQNPSYPQCLHKFKSFLNCERTTDQNIFIVHFVVCIHFKIVIYIFIDIFLNFLYKSLINHSFVSYHDFL